MGAALGRDRCLSKRCSGEHTELLAIEGAASILELAARSHRRERRVNERDDLCDGPFVEHRATILLAER